MTSTQTPQTAEANALIDQALELQNLGEWVAAEKLLDEAQALIEGC